MILPTRHDRRKGKQMKDLLEYIKTDRNGTKYFRDWTCNRCGGAGGSDQWAYTGWECFECCGTGRSNRPRIVKEYTPEYWAKLEARREEKARKWAEEHADEIAAEKAEQERREAERAAEEARREAERLAEIERNRGNFIGTVGDKIELTVTLDHEFHFERPAFAAPWTTEIVNGYVWKTDEGNTLVWLTTGKSLHYETTKENGCPVTVFPENGERMTIKATIKEHKERNDVNQTMLTRVKWVRG